MNKNPRFSRPIRQPLTAEHALAIALAGVWTGITADDQAVARVRRVLIELRAMGFEVTKVCAPKERNETQDAREHASDLDRDRDDFDPGDDHDV